MKIHIQTVIHSNFAEADADGNLKNHKPLQIAIQDFSEEAFVEAFRKLKAERDKKTDATPAE